MEYVYQPLPSQNHIRLLSLEASSESTATIRCHLKTANLDEGPLYKCLSYTWNGPRYTDSGAEWSVPSRTIFVDGVSVRIRRNLHDALTCLKGLDITCFIWIDSLCINQSDLTERASQVANMGHIFESAEDVLVWLGSADLKTKMVLDSLRRFTFTMEEFVEGEMVSDGRQWLPERRYADAKFTIEELSAVVEFYTSLAWFSRIWIAQEIVLAKNIRYLAANALEDMELIWSGSFLMIYAALSNVREKVEGRKELHFVLEFGQTLAIEHLRRRVGEERSNLGVVAHHYRERDATEPKDKVYGVVGISTTPASMPFEVDYTKSVQTIFMEAQLCALATTKGLLALFDVGDRNMNAISKLPSWVPDFTKAISTKALVRGSVKFKAISKSESILWVTKDIPNRLSLNAVLIDTIKSTCDPYWEIGSESVILELLNSVSNAHPSGEQASVRLDTLLYQTVIAGSSQRFSPPKGYDYESGFEQWLFCQLYSIVLSKEGPEKAEVFRSQPEAQWESLRNTGLPSDARGLREAVLRGGAQLVAQEDLKMATRRRMPTSIRNLNTQADPFCAEWEQACSKRRLFVTKGGRLGLGLPGIRTGDGIYLVQGADMPYIFRQVEGCAVDVVHLEGEAYFHGIMYDEADLNLNFNRIFVY